MSHALVRSLAAKAAFPGDWQVVFTVGLDTDQDLKSPMLAWAKDYPVEFRWVERDLFDAYGHVGTRLQCIQHEHLADAVLIMDADVLATGSLAELIEQVATSDAVVGRPAWRPPPDVDLVEFLRGSGLPAHGYGLTYQGHGIVPSLPRECPPYLNFGHIALSRDIARHMARTFGEDVTFVEKNYRSYFNDQLALCLNVARNRYRCLPMDLKYNMGNGAAAPLAIVATLEAAVAYAQRLNAMLDRRVIHYCNTSADFDKARDLDGWDRLQAFCDRTDVRGVGNVLLQMGFRAFL
ncbi:MAG: hypothetical protein OEM98_10770 [Gammaproteobacteria bacterium]|nr:hypothetical protein [Gammaproteobacteria bacterium]